MGNTEKYKRLNLAFHVEDAEEMEAYEYLKYGQMHLNPTQFVTMLVQKEIHGNDNVEDDRKLSVDKIADKIVERLSEEINSLLSGKMVAVTETEEQEEDLYDVNDDLDYLEEFY